MHELMLFSMKMMKIHKMSNISFQTFIQILYFAAPGLLLHVRSSSKPNKAEKKVLQQEFKKCNAQFSLLICTRFQSM